MDHNHNPQTKFTNIWPALWAGAGVWAIIILAWLFPIAAALAFLGGLFVAGVISVVIFLVHLLAARERS